ncbi:MAG: nucleoside-diphosphate kinase [Actinomycetota bacterium]
MSQRTLVLVKPDGVRRKLAGEIIRRFEARNLDIVALKVVTVDEDLAKAHYAEHVEKPFFPELYEFITSGPVVAMVLEGPDCIEAARTTMGVTNPVKASPGTIRGDLGILTTENLVHGSDSPESAEREIKLWFGDL